MPLTSSLPTGVLEAGGSRRTSRWRPFDRDTRGDRTACVSLLWGKPAEGIQAEGSGAASRMLAGVAVGFRRVDRALGAPPRLPSGGLQVCAELPNELRRVSDQPPRGF